MISNRKTNIFLTSILVFMILSSCFNANFLVDRMFARMDSWMDDFEPTETQKQEWVKLKQRLRVDVNRFLGNLHLQLMTVKGKLQKRPPDVDNTVKYIKMRLLYDYAGFQRKLLDYYVELHKILNAEQHKKLYKITLEQIDKVLVYRKKNNLQFDKNIDDMVEELDLRKEQLPHWAIVRKRIKLRAKRYADELVTSLTKLKKDLKLANPKVKDIVAQLQAEISHRNTFSEDSIGYYLELTEILDEKQKNKSYSILEKKIDGFIDFLRG